MRRENARATAGSQPLACLLDTEQGEGQHSDSLQQDGVRLLKQGVRVKGQRSEGGGRMSQKKDH